MPSFINFVKNINMNRKEYIGAKIREARTKNRITQKKLAQLTGIDKTSISKIEKGKLNVTLDTIDKLCNALRTNIRMIDGNKVFEELVFEKHPFHVLADEVGDTYPDYKKSKTCYQAKLQFDNGLNISVVKGELFYSNGVDTYEVCLWAEDYQEVFGYLTDMQVNTLMEYSQIVKDVKLLSLLKENGFELHERPMSILQYIKKYNDWYICVNPCGDASISSSKEPHSFSNVIYYQSFGSIEQILKNLDVYINWCEYEKRSEL